MTPPLTDYLKRQIVTQSRTPVGTLDLLNWPSGWRQFPNLSFSSLDGDRSWEAELPTGSNGDLYVDFQWTPGEGTGTLTAQSWSCYWVLLDMETGTIKEKVFTK